MTDTKAIIINETISISNTSRPNTPSLTIRNPFDADIFVNLIELIPDDLFSIYAKMHILVNGIDINPDSDAPFANYKKFPLPIKVLLRRSQRIEFFAWNYTDSQTLTCDVNIFFDSEIKDIQSDLILLTDRPLIGTALSSATNTIFTCPTGKKVRITGSVILDNYGAASIVYLNANGVPHQTWVISNLSGGVVSGDYDATGAAGTYASWVTQTYSAYRFRKIDVVLSGGQSLVKSQNIGDNATLYYTLKILELTS